MSFDLEVLVVNQSKPVRLPFVSSMELRNEFDEGIQRFKNTWKFMSKTKGIWYSLGLIEGGLFTALNIIDTDFDTKQNVDFLPKWILDEEILSNLTQLIFVQEYKEDILKIMEYLIERSPINTIILLARYQGGDKEIIEGVLTFHEFTTLLEQERIFFNVAYIIKK